MRLDQVTAVEEAVVLADRVRAGVLRRARGAVEFGYDPEYRGPAIATTLPVRSEPFSSGHAGAVPPFFAGLLPEGRRLTALRHAIKTSADDDLSLLLAVGTDLVGHVRLIPAGEPIDEPEESVAERLEDLRFVDLFARVLARDPADRVGLPGVQDKVSGRMISLPVRHRHARWILKLDPPEFPHLVENEAFFLVAARQSGLRVPHHEVVRDRDGAAGLLVQRFDRRGDHRLAVEDGCQVSARYPADKYRLSSEEVVAALTRVCGAPIVAGRDLLRQLVFAYLTCNGDAHGKNFSVVRSASGEWAVSPAYDLPSSHPYGDVTMALTVNGKSREDIGRDDYLALAASCRVRPRAAERVIDEVLAALPCWLDRLHELPFDDRRTHKLRRAVEYRAQRLSG